MRRTISYIHLQCPMKNGRVPHDTSRIPTAQLVAAKPTFLIKRFIYMLLVRSYAQIDLKMLRIASTIPIPPYHGYPNYLLVNLLVGFQLIVNTRLSPI